MESTLLGNQQMYLDEVSGVAVKIVQRVLDSIYGKNMNKIKTERYRGEIVDTADGLKRMYKKLSRVEEFSFDTEFTSLNNRSEGLSDIVGCSFSTGKLNYYVSLGHVLSEDNVPLKVFKKYMRRLFAREDVRIIGHNLKAEFHTLANLGIEVATEDIFDTIVATWNIDENEPVSMDSITKRYYDYDQTSFNDLLRTIPKTVNREYGMTKNSERHIGYVDKHISAYYAMDDTYWTWQIYIDIAEALEEEGIENYFYKLQMPYVKLLFTMERRGVKVNHTRLKEMRAIAEKELEELELEIYELAGTVFDINSPQQKAEIIFGWEKHKLIYKTETTPKLDENGEVELYKVGDRKGNPKYETKYVLDSNKQKIPIGEEFSGNEDLLKYSFKFPYTYDKRVISTHKGKGFQESFPQPSTGADVLGDVLKKQYKSKRKKEGQELIRKLLLYTKVDKLLGTYMIGISDLVYNDGKIHCSFNQTGTTSGRLSCSAPNLQNLPRSLEDVPENPPGEELFDTSEEYEKAYNSWREERDEFDFWSRYEIRDTFVVDDPKETIVAVDYSNLEMRILAHFSQDPLLLRMFQTGVDAHSDTAKNMFKLDCPIEEVKWRYPHLRQQAKTLNFLLVYGGSPQALAGNLGVPIEEAQQLYDLYFDTYKGVSNYMRTQKKFAKRHGYVQTILGRKRHLPLINSKNWGEKGYSERLAVNAPIQGSGADIAISAQLQLESDEILKELGYRQVLQVHDEIVGICPLDKVDEVIERKLHIMMNCLPKPLNGVELKADANHGPTYAKAG